MVRRLAVLSLHTSPLAQPGSGDSGGMNVYVRELVSARWPRRGCAATSTSRRWQDDLPDVVDVEPGFRVVHIARRAAGSAQGGAARRRRRVHRRRARPTSSGSAGVDAIHANYWLSGVAGHRLKHELDLPLVSTFHTLARVKAETGDPEPQRRIEAEAAGHRLLRRHPRQLRRPRPPSWPRCTAPIRAASRSCRRASIHAFFSPGDRGGARNALRLGDHPVLLFVGRIQPLKGLDVAVRALAELRRSHPDAVLVVVGGPSGAEGRRRSTGAGRWPPSSGLPTASASSSPSPTTCCRPTTGPPTSSWCRAGPSRSGWSRWRRRPAASRSWRPPSAGCARLVEHGRTGFLVEGRDPADFAAYARETCANPLLARGARPCGPARGPGATRGPPPPARLRRIYADLTARCARRRAGNG